MEFLGADSDREWSSLNGMHLHTSEEADFMARLLGNSSLPSHGTDGVRTISSTLWHAHEESLSFNSVNHCLSDPPHSFDVNNISMSMDFRSSSYLTEGQDKSNNNISLNNSRIRYRSSGDVSATMNPSSQSVHSKRHVKAKKTQKAVPPSCHKEGNDGQSSSGCSQDESNDSQETTRLSSKRAPALNSNWKSRASRGSATDPQSLYARKRRERINERLRILQNLVPNGTKVDISTMLEEAVQYVKFLQLQIKLLSSDDMWMYAPIAYNGMSIGLDFKVPASRES